MPLLFFSFLFSFKGEQMPLGWLYCLSIPSSPDIQRQVLNCIEILLALVITGILFFCECNYWYSWKYKSTGISGCSSSNFSCTLFILLNIIVHLYLFAHQQALMCHDCSATCLTYSHDGLNTLVSCIACNLHLHMHTIAGYGLSFTKTWCWHILRSKLQVKATRSSRSQKRK